MQKREIEMVVAKGKLSELKERPRVYEPIEGVLLIEELRRMMPEVTGDPDLPIERTFSKRRLSV